MAEVWVMVVVTGVVVVEETVVAVLVELVEVVKVPVMVVLVIVLVMVYVEVDVVVVKMVSDVVLPCQPLRTCVYHHECPESNCRHQVRSFLWVKRPPSTPVLAPSLQLRTVWGASFVQISFHTPHHSTKAVASRLAFPGIKDVAHAGPDR